MISCRLADAKVRGPAVARRSSKGERPAWGRTAGRSSEHSEEGHL